MAEWPELIPAPNDPADWPKWREDLAAFRNQHQTDALKKSYDDPAFAWMRDCIICGKVMLFDREFYDDEHDRFTVEKWVERFRQQFGSLDALVLWQAYPRIGFDSRNQFDHYRLAPGLKEAVATLHHMGVKAFLAYNPWDTGTHREPLHDAEAIGEIVREFRFDGVFLDTLEEGDNALRSSLDHARRGVVMESELALPLNAMEANHASWAQWFGDSDAPGIMRNRWVERRHMMHVIRRWDRDHTSELHMAWMNGSGILVWENIFGSWNGWSDRDAHTLRCLVLIRRHYKSLFEDGEWEPLTPTTLQGVYATRWSLGSTTLWTLVNRNGVTAVGQVLPLASDGTMRLFDLMEGKEIDHALLSLPGHGVGAILRIPASGVDDSLKAFLMDQQRNWKSDYKTERYVRLQTGAWTHRVGADPAQDMVVIEGGVKKLTSRMRVRECGDYLPARFERTDYPELHSIRQFPFEVTLGKFAVARREVTNGQFWEYVKQTGLSIGKDSFLAHWKDGRPSPEVLDEPVTFVSHEDAQAYAAWAGMRLPTEHEWQLAVVEHNLDHGKVWNWTAPIRHDDNHTIYSMLKGGCTWKAIGSDWYADSGPQAPDWTAKYIHLFPSLDRSETIGFRCAMDL